MMYLIAIVVIFDVGSYWMLEKKVLKKIDEKSLRNTIRIGYIMASLVCIVFFINFVEIQA